MREAIIRQMEPKDWEGKAAVHAQAWQETYTGLVDPGFLAQFTVERCLETTRRWPERNLVAELDGSIVGFAVYGTSGDKDLVDAGEIFALYVLKACQGRKIGLALMKSCMEKLAGFKRISLWVLEGNNSAIAFYERFGFRKDGAAKEIQLGTPMNEIRMVMERQ